MNRKSSKILIVAIIISVLAIVMGGCSMVVYAPFAGESAESSSETETPEHSAEVTTAEESGEENTSTEEITATEETKIEGTETEVSSSEEITTEAETTEPEEVEKNLVETEVQLDAAKREVLTLYPGNGEGQVGYSDESRGAILVGPESFAVENGTVYVLDTVNHRVIIGKDGAYSYIDLSEYSRVKYMGCENGRIGVVGYLNDQVVAVYSADGTRVALIELEETGVNGIVNRILSIDDSSVEIQCSDGMRYRCDWTTKTQEQLEKVTEGISEELMERNASVLGRSEDLVYYRYREGSSDVIGKELTNVGRWYTVQELLVYRTIPLKSLYVSEDGRLYLMECFEDRTVISELVLGEE